MASTNPVFRNGCSSNKPPLFYGEHFDLWKIHMKEHLKAQGEEIWDDVENSQFFPTSAVNSVGTTKIKN